MRTLFLLVLGFSLACGGAPAPTPEPQSTTGDESPEEAAPVEYEEEVVEEEFIEEPTGPGSIHAVIRMRNEERAGTITVRTLNGEVVAEGNAGDTIEVPSGSYQIDGMLDPALLPGHSSQQERTSVTPGETAEVVFTYEVARVRLNVRRRGRVLNSWRMVLTREGTETEVTLESSTEHAEVAPGRYSGMLIAGGARIEVTGLIFQGGATMDVPVNVN